MDNDKYCMFTTDDDSKMEKWMNERSRSGYAFVSAVTGGEHLMFTTVIMEKRNENKIT